MLRFWSPAFRSMRCPASFRRARNEDAGYCTSHQSNTHSIESREVLYPWHPWFGRAVWIYATRVNYGRVVAQCGLEQQPVRPGVEVPQWMFDTAVCCQMHMAREPVANVDALFELRSLLASRTRSSPEHVLQAQHHSLSPEGGADANPTEPATGHATCPVSVSAEYAALGTASLGSAAADGALTGADVGRTRRARVGLSNGTGGQR